MKPPGQRLSLVQSPAREQGAPGFASRSDDELMLLARGGSSTAFDALVLRHQRRVLSVAARRLGNVGLAADVAQNTFIEVYRARTRYQPRGHFSAFLYRVLVNQCRMSARTAHAQLRMTSELETLPARSEDEILARERRREVELALARLSEKLRDVIVLRYTAELSYEEIAEVLAIPLGTVKRRLFDAMEKLRRQVEEA